ncbi:hypothetical protein AMATHDRAFT_69919 [Amanita thiersii Skay4041]|uniref:DUF6534 domain-containing protein n=1 Tax=Amanita thiersii Skay4041 TaxID=703135 RepID=A0A2A9NFD0_9AGAR|nr:hypothetical protein AMATHDRAFT_69919 [Amanita thiersii Skay4041]
MSEVKEPLLPIPPNIGQITGSLLVGSFFNFMLYGILILQTYIYIISFSDDRALFKFMVIFTFLLETIQVVCTEADIIYWFGNGFGNLARLNNTYISPFDSAFLCSVIASIVQAFFCYRIWKIKKSYLPIVVIIMTVVVFQLAGGIGAFTVGLHRTFTHVRANPVTAYIWLAGGAIADVLIAITMTILMYGSRSETPAHAQHILVRIVRMSIQTNALTAGFAILTLVFDMALPHTNYFLVPGHIFSKLYSNTLVATFNHRLILRREERSPGQSAQDDLSITGPRGVRITTEQLIAAGSHGDLELQSRKQNLQLTN